MPAFPFAYGMPGTAPFFGPMMPPMFMMPPLWMHYAAMSGSAFAAMPRGRVSMGDRCVPEPAFGTAAPLEKRQPEPFALPAEGKNQRQSSKTLNPDLATGLERMGPNAPPLQVRKLSSVSESTTPLQQNEVLAKNVPEHPTSLAESKPEDMPELGEQTTIPVDNDIRLQQSDDTWRADEDDGDLEDEFIQTDADRTGAADIVPGCAPTALDSSSLLWSGQAPSQTMMVDSFQQVSQARRFVVRPHSSQVQRQQPPVPRPAGGVARSTRWRTSSILSKDTQLKVARVLFTDRDSASRAPLAAEDTPERTGPQNSDRGSETASDSDPPMRLSVSMTNGHLQLVSRRVRLSPSAIQSLEGSRHASPPSMSDPASAILHWNKRNLQDFASK
ncbi:hypothetical protein CAOG_03057 [Capsaspora owczarzaki ATCC 30864]|nr:hypothetical protein CAOG_03057 [Capsaspora owczarzaki ATCC 30864]|eukprot:XP_004363896.1 hypothetical protein CAOG_03057 [Capsaspora owczarzaki ATCC 30864]